MDVGTRVTVAASPDATPGGSLRVVVELIGGAVATRGVGRVVDMGTEVGAPIDIPLPSPQAANASTLTDTRKLMGTTVRMAPIIVAAAVEQRRDY